MTRCRGADLDAQVCRGTSMTGCAVVSDVRRSVLTRLLLRLSTWWLRRRFGHWGKGSLIESPSFLVGCDLISIGERVQIWHSARLEAIGYSPDGSPLISVGDGCRIQPYVHIGAVRCVKVGSECLFASGVYITDHDHDFSDPDDPVVSNGRLLCSPTIIEDRVWLGERVMVLKGVTIGRCSVIGAGSVVTRSIPAYSVAVGSPARVIRTWDSERWRRIEA